MELVLSIMGVALTVIAIWFARRIYEKETEQLAKLEGISRETQEIGSETREVAKKLKADSHLQDAVNRFFAFQATSTRQYTCVFPVFFKRRPLPFIVAGDYHALQVLVGLVGQERLNLRGIMAGETPNLASFGSNVIYLCTPFANAALQLLFPYLAENDSATLQASDFEKLNLPCWFVQDTRSTNRYQGKPLKKIVAKTAGSVHSLESPAENDYAAADRLADDQRHTPADLIQRDFGIILRLTDSKTDSKTVVIAGIHQYGTWIAAEFFDRLCHGNAVSYSTVLIGTDDFAAIVWGTFDTPSLRVLETDVEQNFIWVREESQWKQVPVSAR